MNLNLNHTDDNNSIVIAPKPLIEKEALETTRFNEFSRTMHKSKRRSRVKSIKIEPMNTSITRKLREIIWHGDCNEFNFVANTRILHFTMLQMIRALSFVTLLVCSGLFFFIKVTQGIHFYSFHALITTTITFFFMFIEFGKEKCYQLRYLNPESNGVNMKARSLSWTWGVFFYSLAFPMTIVNNFIYFVNFGGKTSVAHDIKVNIATRNDLNFDIDHP